MSDKTLSAQEFLQGKYPQMRGEKWNSNENINDNWIAEMLVAICFCSFLSHAPQFFQNC